MRPDRVVALLPCLLFLRLDAFSPVINKISVRKSVQKFTATTEDPDFNSYDPFDMNDSSFFSDLTNSSKRIKLQLETAQFIQKYGAQQLLNIILNKVQNVNLPRESKGAINDFLDFVEDLIYSNAAERIEKKLQYDLKKNNNQYVKNRKVHIGEANIQKQVPEYGDEKDHRRRDTPALSQNAILIDSDDNYPAVRQPLEPTKLAFLTHNEPNNFLREESVIRRSPTKNRKRMMTKSRLESAIQSAERAARELEMEKILRKRRVQLARMAKRRREKEMEAKRKRVPKPSRKLPISKIDDSNVRRSPMFDGRVTFNEKMFQLLEEYGIRSFRVETADYTVRAFADPEKTRFSSINLLDVPEYNTAIRRKPARRQPAFVYSRQIHSPKRLQNNRRHLQKRKRGLYLDRLL